MGGFGPGCCCLRFDPQKREIRAPGTQASCDSSIPRLCRGCLGAGQHRFPLHSSGRRRFVLFGSLHAQLIGSPSAVRERRLARNGRRVRRVGRGGTRAAGRVGEASPWLFCSATIPPSPAPLLEEFREVGGRKRKRSPSSKPQHTQPPGWPSLSGSARRCGIAQRSQTWHRGGCGVKTQHRQKGSHIPCSWLVQLPFLAFYPPLQIRPWKLGRCQPRFREPIWLPPGVFFHALLIPRSGVGAPHWCTLQPVHGSINHPADWA